MNGKIQDFGIPDIFQLVSSQQKSGALTITVGERETVFLFSEGNIVDVQPDRREPAAMLGTMLVDAGYLTTEELRRTLAACEKSRRKLGEELVEKETLSNETLTRFLSLQIKESVFDVIGLKEGNYDFEGFAVLIPAWMRTAIRPDVLMMEGMQFLDEYPMFRAKFPAGDFHIGRKRGEKIETSALSEPERIIWKVIDFSNEPKRVFRKALITSFEGIKALAALHDRGLIEVTVPRKDKGDSRTLVRAELERGRTIAIVRGAMWGLTALLALSWIYATMLSADAGRAFSSWISFF